jgi:hypothetical protein
MSVIDSMAAMNTDHEDPAADPKIYGVVVGRVINLLDPLMLGRVQVQLPAIDALELSPWARVAAPAASLTCGFYWIPNLEDEVLVAFEQGDLTAPYIIGCLWSAIMLPPLPSPLPQIRAIRTLAGNQIVFTDVPPSVTIQTGPTPPEVLPSLPSPVGPYQTILLSPLGIDITSPGIIKIESGTNSIMLTPGGIILQAGASTISITTAGIIINGSQIGVTSTGTITILGTAVTIN